MSRIRALALSAGLAVTASVVGAAVWYAGTVNDGSAPAAPTRDLALAGAAGAVEAGVVSAVERGLVAPRVEARGRQSRPDVAAPAPVVAAPPATNVAAEPIAGVPAPPIAEPQTIAEPEPQPVAVAAAPSAPANPGAVGVTALEPGETIGVFAGWNGANADAPELPVIRANMPAVRLGGIGGGQCGGRRGGGTLVLR